MSDSAGTILIKKIDGTTERISLAEFRARQSSQEILLGRARQKQTAPPAAPVLKEQGTINKEQFIAKPEKKIEPMKPFVFVKPVVLVTPVPKEQGIISAQGGSASGGKKDDAASLLEEPLMEDRPDVFLTSQSRVSQADEIINKLNFRAPDPIRLRGLIQLRLKDVRSEEETRAWLTRSITEGGAGISAMQADDVLKLCRGEKVLKSADNVQPLKKGLPNELVAKAEYKSAPIVYKEQPVPALISAKKSFIA